jgi:hypothetical protein
MTGTLPTKSLVYLSQKPNVKTPKIKLFGPILTLESTKSNRHMPCCIKIKTSIPTPQDQEQPFLQRYGKTCGG